MQSIFFSEEQDLFRDSVRQFAEREVVPHAEQFDQHGVFPHDMFRRMGQLGYYGLRYPESVGGQEADFVTTCILYEELARASLSIAAICAMQSLMGTYFVFKYGTDAQRQQYLVPALRGELVGTIGMTEPNAGSDLGGMRTQARRDGDGWIIKGNKTWITNAPVANFVTIAAKTSEERGMDNVALFLVDTKTPGFSVGKPIEKLGVRSTMTSEIALDDVRLPSDALLGNEGEGVKNVGGILSEIRVMTGALSVGLAQAALEAAGKYANEREAFGQSISRFQAISFKLADMATQLHAARLMTYDGAWRIDQGLPLATEASMTKLFASEAAATIVDETTRIFGSYGFAMEYPAQRFFRDARFLLNGGGTSEILRMLIGREISKGFK
ncbi:MAG: acyl-CoA dehydrogenase family protein [Chloroflexi bacterium]|nr:acyl-CoA dehydrogenase family protein [Chloroflexota bacterium]